MFDVLSCICRAENGELFVCGGGDKLVKLWGYDEGYCYHRGVGHSGDITQVVIAPDQRTIVSCGEEGAIFLWKMPNITLQDKEESGGEQAQQQTQPITSPVRETTTPSLPRISATSGATPEPVAKLDLRTATGRRARG